MTGWGGQYRLISLAFLFCALVCYGLGVVNGASVFLGLGLILELMFWYRTLRYLYKRHHW